MCSVLKKILERVIVSGEPELIFHWEIINPSRHDMYRSSFIKTLYNRKYLELPRKKYSRKSSYFSCIGKTSQVDKCHKNTEINTRQMSM